MRRVDIASSIGVAPTCPALDDEWLAAAFYGIGFEITRTLVKCDVIDGAAAADFDCQLVIEGIRAFAAPPDS